MHRIITTQLEKQVISFLDFMFFVTTAVSYQWMKDTSFLIQALNSYFFLSADGNLYFSEVQQNDEGSYHCIVTLTAFPGDTLATDQPPTETSLEIKLDVLGDSKYFADCSSQCSRFLLTEAITSDGTLIIIQNYLISAAALYPPQIHDDFPAVFPKAPRLGQTITIECLAYGRCGLVYFLISSNVINSRNLFF